MRCIVDIPSINNLGSVAQPLAPVRPATSGQSEAEASPAADVPLLGQQATPPVNDTAGTEADPKKPDKEKLKEAIDSANDGLKNLQNKSSALEFAMDHDLGRVIVRLVDTETKEVIRQYPPEEILEIARQMDKLVGKLLKEKA